MKAKQQSAADDLHVELRHRGWKVESEGDRLKAGRPGWPVQVYVLVHFGDQESASVMALVIDLSAMPLAGERFRDVFNADRQELLRGMGQFRVRQLLMNGAWAPEMDDRAFLTGLNPGIRLTTRLAILDACPAEAGAALAIRFISESARFVETGNLISETLGRVYLPGVLKRETPVLELAAVVPGTLRSD